MFDQAEIVAILRAVGEPTRLRLLALCTLEDCTVTALAATLRQSEPGISRHLRQLHAAGLVERIPDGQWVRYRLTRRTREAELARTLLAAWPHEDPVRLRDAERLRLERAAEVEQREQRPGSARLGRALGAFVAGGTPAGKASAGSLVVVLDAAHPELLPAAARLAERLIVLAPSRPAARRLRTAAALLEVDCEIRVAELDRAGGLARALDALPRPDFAMLDRRDADPRRIAPQLRELAQRLEPGGALWLFSRYEALEQPRGPIVEHPIARLRRLIGEAGLRCERLQPIEADGEHVLAAAASARAASEQVA